MISYIKGILVQMGDSYIVVENQGIGYDISISGSAYSKLPSLSEEVKIFTYLYVKEDAMKLFGFLEKDDLEVFKLLITVSGIGPKGALQVLSVLSADDLRFAILADDAKTIAKAPGIGIKTAGKLILELKDKFNLDDAFSKKEQNISKQQNINKNHSVSEEAILALVALGYSNTEAMKAVRSIEINSEMDVEDVLKVSLKAMSNL